VSATLADASFRALGTTAHVAVVDPAALGEALTVVEAELDAIDLACSRFRDDSELMRVNRAAGRPVAVGPLLLEALTVAVRAAAATDGDVDPTVGRALSGLGWDRDFDVVVSRTDPRRIEVVPAAGWRTVRIDPARPVVRVPRGVAIDLGSTAKALAADRCARAVAERTGTGVLVDLGGDIALAGETPGDGWPVLVTDDHRSGPDADGQRIALASGGLATSSTTVRRWQTDGSELHHIVDPRTGLPAREIWRTVTVAAGSCVDANTASTAAIVRGEGAVPWLEAAALPARLVRPDGEVVRTAGWPAEDA
jgi:thiamine biosynthesis lipoprotein